MNVLAELVESDHPVVLALVGEPAAPAAAGWDNRPTWDNWAKNPSPWNNQPTWDNWTKK